MRLGGEAWLRPTGQRPALVQPTAHNRRSLYVKLAKVAHRLNILWIELYSSLERITHLAGKRKGGQRTGMRGFHAIGSAQPHLGIAIARVLRGCEFARLDRGICHLLGIVDAAEQLVGVGIAWLRRKYALQCDACFIDTPLL